MNVFITSLQIIVWSCGLFTGVTGLYNYYSGEDHVMTLFFALGCFLTIYVVMYYYTRFKYKNRLKEMIFDCHQFNHALRDWLVKFENDIDRTNRDLLRKEIIDITQNSLDLLSDALSSYTGKKICVHYKQIPFENNSDSSPEPMLMTLSLCKNTKKLGDRHVVRRHKISDSVAYGELYNEHIGHCYFPNFRRNSRRFKKVMKKDFIKKNDKVDKYYGSVAYAAVQRDLGNDNFDVRGILVADHSWPFTFLPLSRDKAIITELMKNFADGLYIAMVKYNQAEKINQNSST